MPGQVVLDGITIGAAETTRYDVIDVSGATILQVVWIQTGTVVTSLTTGGRHHNPVTGVVVPQNCLENSQAEVFDASDSSAKKQKFFDVQGIDTFSIRSGNASGVDRTLTIYAFTDA
jgi:hypothetical protein